jgi:DNA-binding response OmpR family regulator
MAPVRILIVEDERLVGFDLRRRFARMGYTVVAITASGEEAIAYSRSRFLKINFARRWSGQRPHSMG